MQRGYKTARRLHDSQSCAELMKHNKRIHNMTPSQFVSVWINAPQFTERSCSFQHRRYKHTEQPPLQASSPSPLLSLTTYENHRFVEIKKKIITLTGYKKKEQPHSLFWFTKFSRDMLYFQWKLITRKGEPLLAYLPSIAMMFCFGFHQSGRWRRGSGPLQGWRTGGDSCGGTVHKRAGRKQTVWDKRWTNI